MWEMFSMVKPGGPDVILPLEGPSKRKFPCGHLPFVQKRLGVMGPTWVPWVPCPEATRRIFGVLQDLPQRAPVRQVHLAKPEKTGGEIQSGKGGGGGGSKWPALGLLRPGRNEKNQTTQKHQDANNSEVAPKK